jgi:aspartyl-tRNA(Asn)/glutamyl-tRNA(Gln) amidotransferase subunit B
VYNFVIFAIIINFTGISDGVMANGNLRVDVNVSMEDSESPEKSGDRVEIKNLNSLKSIEKAINFEIGRQTECFHQGNA